VLSKRGCCCPRRGHPYFTSITLHTLLLLFLESLLLIALSYRYQNIDIDHSYIKDTPCSILITSVRPQSRPDRLPSEYLIDQLERLCITGPSDTSSAGNNTPSRTRNEWTLR